MLLAVDIGNTNINLGIFKAGALLKRLVLPTRSRDYAPFLKKIYSANKIKETVICSVVPEATAKLVKAIRKVSVNKPYIIGKGLKAPVRNLYKIKKEVGMDRLVNAYAGIRFYGAPLIIVDFGTAITFDVVSKNKEYLGGMILPGLNISLEALWQKTALLPKIRLEKPEDFIGRDTKTSILSGLLYGFGSLTDELSQRIKKVAGKNAKVILTGGNTDLIKEYCSNIDAVDKDLTLKGINLIYLANV